MPRMWFIKDGLNPTFDEDYGEVISFDEIEEVFGNYPVGFLSVDEQHINEDKPSTSARHVIIQIDGSDGVNATFTKEGYWLLKDLSPNNAKTMLKKHRDK